MAREKLFRQLASADCNATRRQLSVSRRDTLTHVRSYGRGK